MRPGLREALAWPALATLLLAGALLMQGADNWRWDWQPALMLKEPWRAWTAAWVHWSPLHLALNLAGGAGVAWLGWRARARPRDALAWLLAWPLVQAGLALQPGLQHYGGLSGVLHAGLAVLCWRLVAGGPGRERWIGSALALGLVAKLLTESPWRDATRSVPGWDFALAPGAHLSGALAGLVCAALLAALARGALPQDRPAHG